MDKQSLCSSLNSIPQRLLWPCAPASAVTGAQEVLLLPTLFSDLPQKGFFLCRFSHIKMRRYKNVLSIPYLLMWTNFLKTVSFLLENFCFEEPRSGAECMKQTTISIYNSTTQWHPGSLGFYQFCWNKIFKRLKKLITHSLSQFNTKKERFPTVSFINSAKMIAFLSVKSQTTITSFSKKTLAHNRLKKIKTSSLRLNCILIAPNFISWKQQQNNLCCICNQCYCLQNMVWPDTSVFPLGCVVKALGVLGVPGANRI